MCDYSLHCVAHRDAKAHETIVTTTFRGTSTRGFSSPEHQAVAVCLRPGTEIMFDEDVKTDGMFDDFVAFWQFVTFRRSKKGRAATFTQIDKDKPDVHHDALQFASGEIVLITNLVPGQKATIVTLPVAESKPPVLPKSEIAIADQRHPART